MPSQPNPSLRTRLRRNRLWVAGGRSIGRGGGGKSASGPSTPATGKRGWRVPRRVRARPTAPFRPSDTQWTSLRLAVGAPRSAFRDETSDRRQDRHQRGHDDADLLALLRQGQQIDRAGPAISSNAARRCSPSKPASSCRATTTSSPPWPASRRRALAARAGADRREEAASATCRRSAAARSKDLEQAQSDLVAGAGRPALGRRSRLAAVRNRPAHPRPVGRRHRAAREDRPHRRRDHRVRADCRHDHPAQGRVGPSTSTPAPTTRSSRSAISRRYG